MLLRNMTLRARSHGLRVIRYVEDALSLIAVRPPRSTRRSRSGLTPQTDNLCLGATLRVRGLGYVRARSISQRSLSAGTRVPDRIIAVCSSSRKGRRQLGHEGAGRFRNASSFDQRSCTSASPSISPCTCVARPSISRARPPRRSSSPETGRNGVAAAIRAAR